MVQILWRLVYPLTSTDMRMTDDLSSSAEVAWSRQPGFRCGLGSTQSTAVPAHRSAQGGFRGRVGSSPAAISRGLNRFQTIRRPIQCYAAHAAPPHSHDRTPDGIIVIICAPNVLTAEELGAIRSELRDTSFVDGADTAGWSAREVKKNLQAAADTESQARLRDIVRTAFMRNALLQTAVLPVALTHPLFNRYDVGMQYGRHVDAPVMGGVGSAVRTDVAITLFLSDPASYDGGDLVIDASGMEYGFKLDAGSAIAYPANSLHHVTPVTRGSRRAAILWVQSQVRDPAQRELLWDLDNAKRQIFGREGKSATFDTISKSHANLLRMWANI